MSLRPTHAVLALLIIASAHPALGQICVIRVTPPVPVTRPAEMPAYEVATIKPVAPDGFAPPFRMYIQEAYGIQMNTVDWVIGPDWTNSAKFVIDGKPPDSIRDAMKTMSNVDQQREKELMMQSLLADRFQFKAHFEAREMPVYELTIAKGGSKLRDSADPTKPRVSVGSSMVRGTSTLQFLIDALQCSPDLGRRKIIDKTGLTGIYDYSLKWSPMQAASAAGSAAAPAGVEGPDLFTAIEDQLGLKLVPTKGPGEVLIIDRIEQPTPN